MDVDIEVPWGSLSIAYRRPHPGLRRIVVAYRGFVLNSYHPLLRIETPMGLPSLFVGFGEQVEWVKVGSTGERRTVPASVAIGSGTRANHVAVPSSYRGMQILLTPAGASQLFGPRMSEFADTVVDALDAVGGGIRFLPERLAHAGGWAERFELLDSVFFELSRYFDLDDGYELSGPLMWAWRRLHTDGGIARIDELVEGTGWSQRRLELAFRRHIGLPPKGVARMARFRRAVRLLAASAASPDEIAVECGYYDQAHLIRDFRAVTGTTPGRFREGGATLYPDAALGPAGLSAATVLGGWASGFEPRNSAVEVPGVEVSGV